MTFGVQFDLSTGVINGTISPAATDAMPDGRSQLVFPEWVDTTNMMVDLATMEMIAIPGG
jgi:hypothetical protein